jgi:hypothetical protein
VWVRRAPTQKDEGSELYVRSNAKTVLVNIQTHRLFDADHVEKFLRHELMRISDMLDPAFQYSKDAPLGGSSELEDNLIRDRFRILWDLSISLRLLKRGFGVLVPLERQRQFYERAFSKWPASVRAKTFHEILNQKSHTQSDLLELARDQKLAVPLGLGGLLCPLCHFTSFDPVDLSSEKDSVIMNEIREDNPGWHIELGICRNCLDLYQSKLKVAS